MPSWPRSSRSGGRESLRFRSATIRGAMRMAKRSVGPRPFALPTHYSPTAVASPDEPAAAGQPLARRRALLPVCLVVSVALGLVSVWLGQDTSWDLRNYHLYTAHAWFTGRHDIDVAPAFLNTFHNPVLDL